MLPQVPRATGRPALLGNRYEILSPLGSGSAADVFKVRDRRGGALRAAKVLKPENAAVPDILARFEDEFRILRTLHHPHLPEVHDYGWTPEGGRFLIMELVEGEPLDAYFKARPTDIWVILYQLCETLTFVHSHNLLHQDIKPSNILVKRTSAFGAEMPLVKLIDFGLTYRRDTGAAVQLAGTPEYVAPEVVRGEAPLTRAVDYYSLGATLYELLCGAPPFVGKASDVLRAQVEQEPVVEDEHLEWAELYPHVRALLTKDRRARLEAFEEFRRAVVSRLTGGIEELDRAYGLARIDSLPMIGKEEVWKELMEWVEGVQGTALVPHVLTLGAEQGSGRSFLLDRLRAEGSARGICSYGFGSMSDYSWFAEEGGHDVDRFDLYAKLWRRMRAGSESTPVMLVIDGSRDVLDDELGFLRFVATQLELARSEDGPSRVFTVLVRERSDEKPIIDISPGEQREIKVPALDTLGRDALVHAFRGEFADSNHARILARSVAAATTTRAAIQLLTTAIRQNRLVFSGGRWTVDARMAATAPEVESGDPDVSDIQTRGLAWDILANVACHDQAVSIDWLRDLTNAPTESLRTQIDELRRRGFVRGGVIGGAEGVVIPEGVSRVIRASLPSASERAIRNRFIRVLNGVLANVGPSVDVCMSLAHHHDLLGNTHEADRIRIGGIAERKRKRDFEGVERIAASQIQLKKRDAIRRYYLRQLVESLRERNHHTRTYRVLNEFFGGRIGSLPLELVPGYVKGMSDALGPRAALGFLQQNYPRLGTTERMMRLRLEKAFLLLALGLTRESTAELQIIISGDGVLAKRDRYRARIYDAMNHLNAGGFREAIALLDSVASTALSDGCVDEFVLAQTVRAQSLTMAGDPRLVLGLCAETVRIARRHGLDFRRNVLYRLAASAHNDLGDRKRARIYQEQALRLANVLGMREFEAMSWARLAQYEASAGCFGNALRYVDKALSSMDEDSSMLHRTQAQVHRLWLHMWLKSPELFQHVRATGRVLHGLENVNEKGRVHLIMGQVHEDRGAMERARRSYEHARALFRESGFCDNQAMALRALVRTHVACGALKEAEALLEDIRAVRREVTSQNAKLECELASLELHLAKRSSVRVLRDIVTTCDNMCKGAVDVNVKLEALSLMLRVNARHGNAPAVEELFYAFVETARHVAANVGPEHAEGLAGRLNLGSLSVEAKAVRRRQVRPDHGSGLTA